MNINKLKILLEFLKDCAGNLNLPSQFFITVTVLILIHIYFCVGWYWLSKKAVSVPAYFWLDLIAWIWLSFLLFKKKCISFVHVEVTIRSHQFQICFGIYIGSQKVFFSKWELVFDKWGGEKGWGGVSIAQSCLNKSINKYGKSSILTCSTLIWMLCFYGFGIVSYH